MVDGVDSSLLISGSGHLISSRLVEFLLLCWAGLPSMSMADCPTVLREAIVGQRPLPVQDGNTTDNGQQARGGGGQPETGGRGDEEGALGRDLGGIWTESLLRLGQRGGIDGNERTRFYRRARHCAGTPVALGAACVSEGGRDERRVREGGAAPRRGRFGDSADDDASGPGSALEPWRPWMEALEPWLDQVGNHRGPQAGTAGYLPSMRGWEGMEGGIVIACKCPRATEWWTDWWLTRGKVCRMYFSCV